MHAAIRTITTDSFPNRQTYEQSNELSDSGSQVHGAQRNGWYVRHEQSSRWPVMDQAWGKYASKGYLAFGPRTWSPKDFAVGGIRYVRAANCREIEWQHWPCIHLRSFGQTRRKGICEGLKDYGFTSWDAETYLQNYWRGCAGSCSRGNGRLCEGVIVSKLRKIRGRRRSATANEVRRNLDLLAHAVEKCARENLEDVSEGRQRLVGALEFANWLQANTESLSPAQRSELAQKWQKIVRAQRTGEDIIGCRVEEAFGRRTAAAREARQLCLVKPPRLIFGSIAQLLLKPAAFKRYVEPAIADMQEEYFACLSRGNEHGARWAVIRGNFYAVPNWCWAFMAQLLLKIIQLIRA
jgi:hypothetical protein